MEFKYVYRAKNKYCEDCGEKKVISIPSNSFMGDIEVVDCIECNQDYYNDVSDFLNNHKYDNKSKSYVKVN